MEDTVVAIAIRNRIVGTLVKRARRQAGRSQKECAALLGCSHFAYGRYEQGQWGLSLAYLEILARLFKVPLSSLLDDAGIPPDEPDEDPHILYQALLLRRKMLAVQFRQCRRASGLSQQQAARLIGHSVGRVARYERAESDIPISELEVVAERCGKSLSEFVDEPPAPDEPTDRERQALANLNELDPEVRDFVLKPTNALYLRIALLLSSMKADSLRQIAETLLDITY